MKVGDAPGCPITVADGTEDELVSFPLARARGEPGLSGPFPSRASSSSGAGPMLVKVELGLISAGVLPSSCEELAIALVYLAPATFHEAVEQSSERKLLERLLADNVNVRIPYVSQFGFFHPPSPFFF